MPLDVEALFRDAEFDDYLRITAKRKQLSFPDYKQEVFARILERAPDTVAACKRVANSCAMEWYRGELSYLTEYSFDESIDSPSDGFDPSEGNVLWEDRHVLK